MTPRRIVAIFLVVAAMALAAIDPESPVRRLYPRSAASASASVSAGSADDGFNPRTHARIPHAPPQPGEVRLLAIKQLGNFDFDPAAGKSIPPDVKKLDGLIVRLVGYMIPAAQAGEAINQFALVPTIAGCCYGQPPGVQHTIIVLCPPGRSVRYSPNLVQVTGPLAVRETKQDGYVVSLFQVTCNSVMTQ